MDMALQAGMPDYQREQPEQQVVAVLAGRRDDDGARQLFLDAGRVLMLLGWGVLLAAASAAGRENDDDDRPDTSSATHALFVFAVSLVALVHVERRFPRVGRESGSRRAANAVVDYFFVPL